MDNIMAQNTHTPGPWSIRHDKGFNNDVIRSNGRLLATCYPEASPNGRLNKAGQSEAEANARLIAAAPDLLTFVESITNASGPYAYLNGTQIVADAYRLAAKARGEAA